MRNKQSIQIIGVVFLIVGIFCIVSGAAVQAASQSPSTTTSTIATATNPYPPYSGSLIMNDPMQDNSKGYEWDETTDSAVGACQFKEGAYHSSIPAANTDEICTAEGSGLINFVLQINMTFLSGDGGGLLFRETSHIDNGMYTILTCYEFVIGTNGFFTFLSYSYFGSGNPQTNVLSSGNSAAIQQGLNQSNLIAVVALGTSFTLYVNKQQIAIANDNSFSSGQIGVLARDTTNQADVAFSNLQVWTLPL